MVDTSLTVLIIVEGQKPASVELRRVDRNLTVRCNCSSEDKICNHIISTLFGEEARIVGCDGTLTKTIADMLAGSDVEHAFWKLRDLTVQSAELKAELAKARTDLGEAILDYKPW